ncbi:hypothetical protein [Microbacterium sp.]|uniref:hypothetical protein n=1 Tax=Microbacterium sp. TaxID=51671 RepID=UPI0035635184
MATLPECAVLRCTNESVASFQHGEAGHIREWLVCGEHSLWLGAGQAWAFDGHTILMDDDMPPTVHGLTIHNDGEPEFTVTLEYGTSLDETESLTLRLPPSARRLLHAALSSRVDD